MRRLTDCGDGFHDPVRDLDSYGNSMLKCRRCGNRVYNKNLGDIDDGYGGSNGGSNGGGGTYLSNSADISKYSIDKPTPMIHGSTTIDYSSTSGEYTSHGSYFQGS